MAAAPEVLNVSMAARSYVNHGWVVVPIASGTKGPNHVGWQLRENCVSTIEQCTRVKANVGLAHAYSGTCVIDIDDLQKARVWFSEQGVDLDELRSSPEAVRISSGRENRDKLLFKLPPEVKPIITRQMPEFGFELRCASGSGNTMQDVLPPSIHPETGRPYVWEYDELLGHWSEPPVLPDDVFKLWSSLRRTAEKSVDEKAPLGLGRGDVRKLLAQFDPNCGYQDWINAGFAVHHEMRGADLGLELWDEWSAEGLTYPGEDALARHWNSFGQGYTGPLVTARSLMSKVGICDVEDFDNLEDPPTPAEKAEQKPKFSIAGAGEFASGPPLSWIIKGVLPRAALGVIFGESGAGKSFVVMDMIAAVARGVDWRGCRTKAGRVVMVVAEGLAGARGRLAAYARHHGVDLTKMPFGVIGDVPNLKGMDHKLIAAQVREWGGADIIVVDTLAQSVAGANENSAEDMGMAIKHCKQLHESTGALVLLVHHSGKDASRGARGWSGIKAACDVELEVLRNGNQRSFKVSKSKDGRDGDEVAFKLNTVVLGEDEDGDDITSCVVEYTNEPIMPNNPKDKLTEKHHAVMGVLQEAEILAGPVHFADLKRMTIDRLVPGDKSDNRGRDADKAIARLEELGYIVKGEGSMYSLKAAE